MSHFVLTVNGESVDVDAGPFAPLADVLRNGLGLSGTKKGCGEGECGACAVLLDGAVVNSCLVPVARAAGREITTIEGVVEDADYVALAASLGKHGGVQCGFCSPAVVLAVLAHLRAGGGFEPDAVRLALSGNLCRCTGYGGIIRAVAALADVFGNQQESTPDE